MKDKIIKALERFLLCSKEDSLAIEVTRNDFPCVLITTSIPAIAQAIEEELKE